jgi:hypothetical protein
LIPSCAVVISDQIVVRHVISAAIGKGWRGEIRKILGKVVSEVVRQNREIVRRRDLLLVGQARRIVIECVLHSECARFRGHHLGEMSFAAADRFGDGHGDVVGREHDDRLDGDVGGDGVAGADMKFGRVLAGRVFRHRDGGRQGHLPALQLLEQQVERHHLRQ